MRHNFKQKLAYFGAFPERITCDGGLQLKLYKQNHNCNFLLCNREILWNNPYSKQIYWFRQAHNLKHIHNCLQIQTCTIPFMIHIFTAWAFWCLLGLSTAWFLFLKAGADPFGDARLHLEKGGGASRCCLRGVIVWASGFTGELLFLPMASCMAGELAVRFITENYYLK